MTVTVRNVSGAAVGCLGYVLSDCVESLDTVTVTRRHLDPLDPRAMHCEVGAPVVRVESVVYPRCNTTSGVVTSCTRGGGASEVPYPRKHPGLVSL